MNTKNNKRAKDTDEAIVRAVFETMWKKHCPIGKITVREVCEKAKINRSTFYAHYQDVFDVVEKAEKSMANLHAQRLMAVFQEGGGFREAMESVFCFVKEYRDFYSLYFKETNGAFRLIDVLNFPFQERVQKIQKREGEGGVPGEGVYHYRFFTAGMASLLTIWLDRDCRETPAELYEILEREYGENSLFHSWSKASGSET